MNDISEDTKQKKDKIEVIGDSLIQHGKLNDRVYLMRISESDDTGNLVSRVLQLVEENNYSKVFGKVPAAMVPELLQHKFRVEAVIPNFYYGSTDAFLMSTFFSKHREIADPEAMINFRRILAEFKVSDLFYPEHTVPVQELKPEHAQQIAQVYKKVFESYPFPIHDPNYIVDTMKTHVRYFGVWDKNRLMAVSSAEIDDLYKNAEMTDFAADPDFRGRKLACYLLHEMENQLAQNGIKTAYTIARLHSPAMNITFLKNGYKYSGTLVRNTNIAGKIESMNVYYKPLK